MGNKKSPCTDWMAKDYYETFRIEIYLPLTASANSFESISKTSLNETKLK